MAAAQCQEIEAVVADCAYATLARAADQHFRWILRFLTPLVFVPVRWFGERILKFNIADVSPLSVVRKISPRPLLLIHAQKDWLILPEDSRLLFEAAGEPKELWLVEGAFHGWCHWTAPEAYEAKVTEFFKRSLSVRAASEFDVTASKGVN